MWERGGRLLLLVLMACGGGGSPSPAPDAPPPPIAVSLAIAMQSGSVPLYVGGPDVELSATVTYDDGSTQDVTDTAVWGSSSNAVAVTDGRVTAMNPGLAMVSAEHDGVGATMDVRVMHARLVFVANRWPVESITVYAPTASGDDIPPMRFIRGSATRISEARGLWATDGELFIVTRDSGILVFPLTASGNVAPARWIHGPAAQIYSASDISVAGGEIFVAASRIVAFPETADGMVEPSRVLTVNGGYLDVHATEDAIFAVSGITNSIDVFPFTASNEAEPMRSIAGPATGLDGVQSLFVTENEIFAVNGTDKTIGVFPIDAEGDVAPTRVIEEITIGTPGRISVAGDELYMTEFVSSFLRGGYHVFPTAGAGPTMPLWTVDVQTEATGLFVY